MHGERGLSGRRIGFRHAEKRTNYFAPLAAPRPRGLSKYISPVLRPSGPIAIAALLACLFAGCDPFSTKSFVSKPGEVTAFQGPEKSGDSVVFHVRESLIEAGTGSEISRLADKRVSFVLIGDTLSGADTLRLYRMRVTDEAAKALIEESTRALRVSSQGVELRLQGQGGGARFFPMKVAAAADSGSFKALPLLFAEGLEWTADLGIFKVTRNIEGTDTIDTPGRLEETWRVAETVADGDRVLARGAFWYGASGLLKAEQTWDDFDRRNDAGASAGKAVLKRALERL